ncbi:MAG: hypothetical protein ACLP07_12085 [Terracidiphilus sp.]
MIDHVYSNEPLAGGAPSNPHKWDIQLARDADNEMRVYCKFPETLNLFRKAVGLYNPAVSKAAGVDLEALDEFRRQVARELELPTPVPSDKNLVWISSLAGAAPSDSVNGMGGK